MLLKKLDVLVWMRVGICLWLGDVNVYCVIGIVFDVCWLLKWILVGYYCVKIYVDGYIVVVFGGIVYGVVLFVLILVWFLC